MAGQCTSLWATHRVAAPTCSALGRRAGPCNKPLKRLRQQHRTASWARYDAGECSNRMAAAMSQTQARRRCCTAPRSTCYGSRFLQHPTPCPNARRTTRGAAAAAAVLGPAAALLVAPAAHPAALLALTPALDQGLYQISQDLDQLVQQQLNGLSPLSFGIVLLAGLGTSLSPCTLSVLPLTIGYIGGYAAQPSERGSGQPRQQQQQKQATQEGSSPEAGEGSNNSSNSQLAAAGKAGSGSTASNSGSSRGNITVQALCFSLGLASTLAGLGLASSLLGRAYGQGLGDGLPLLVSCIAILMGLNLLEVLPLQLPSLDVDVRKLGLPPPLQAYLVGATFALAASPCSTPVLATILGWVATSEDPLTGAGLLLAYSCGYVAPLLVAATATGAMRQVVGLRAFSSWVPTASGVLLLAGGTYTLLSRLVPA